MITKLPEWYHIATIDNLKAETLELRSSDITKNIKSRTLEWMFDCSRFFLGKPLNSPAFITELTDLFLKGDPLFPQKDNLLELQILSGALLHEYIVGGKGKDGIHLSLAIKCGQFGVEPTTLINTDILDDINIFYASESVKIRTVPELKSVPIMAVDASVPELNGEHLSTKFTQFNNHLKTITNAINDLGKYSSKRLDIIEEESNIHWWLFRGFCNESNSLIKNLNPKTAPIILGKELSGLINLVPAPYSSIQFLNKAFGDYLPGIENELSIEDSINQLEKKHRESYCKNAKPTLTNLCPITLGCAKSLEVDDDKSWQAFFHKAVGFKPSLKVNIHDLAMQSLMEKLLERIV